MLVWCGERWGVELTWLHLGDEFLVEETSSLFVKRAVDGDNITSVLEVSKSFLKYPGKFDS